MTPTLWYVKATARTRSILHVDLDPFLVSVERSLDPSLEDRPVVVGARPDGSGVVAAASAEARAAGVRVGQSIAAARRACPGGVFRPGDLDTYARFSEDVTSILLAASRRVERPSADEAYVDLTREDDRATAPVAAAEAIKDELQRRLGLDASLGLASSRLAARVASTWARPRGLLVVLPGYEACSSRASSCPSSPTCRRHIETALEKAGFETLGQVGDGQPRRPRGDGRDAAAASGSRMRRAARARSRSRSPRPRPSIQEEAVIRARRTDRAALSRSWAASPPRLPPAPAVRPRRGRGRPSRCGGRTPPCAAARRSSPSWRTRRPRSPSCAAWPLRSSTPCAGVRALVVRLSPAAAPAGAVVAVPGSPRPGPPGLIAPR